MPTLENIQEIIDELKDHISKINHFNEAPIKKGVIDCLYRLEQALSKNKDGSFSKEETTEGLIKLQKQRIEYLEQELSKNKDTEISGFQYGVEQQSRNGE